MLKFRIGGFLLIFVFMLAFGVSSVAAAEFQLQSTNIIPPANAYVQQTYSMELTQGKLVFRGLTLDPRFEGFLTVWMRGDTRRIMIHMNAKLIEVQAGNDGMRTILQQPASLRYPGRVEVEIANGQALIRLGNSTFTLNGVTDLSGVIDSIGISGEYDFSKYIAD